MSSNITHPAASMAQVASTALPPRSNIFAPAVADSGLPVIAIQCRPCSGGLWVCARAGSAPMAKPATNATNKRTREELDAAITSAD
jgi:hypothetical protein